MWLTLLLIFLLVCVLALYLVKHSFSAMPDPRRFVQQSHIVPNSSIGEGDVYRSLAVKDGPLHSEPFPGVKTLYDLFQ